ncbi:MAG: hypothetical protein ABSE46_20195 [Terracidiphilus sp.]|jgi:hypothetical protein
MKQIRWFGAFELAAIVFVFGLSLAAQTGDTAAIQQKFSTVFTATRLTADRSDIVTAGSIVVLHKEGMMMYGSMSPLPPSNTYKNGKIVQGGSGFGRDLAISMLTPGGGTSASYPQRKFVAEEKCFLLGLVVQKDGILIQLYSDPYDDVRYYGNLKIPFPNKKEVPSVDAALQMVAEVLTVAPTEDQGGQQGGAPVEGPSTSPVQDGQSPTVPGQYSTSGGSRLLLLSDGSFTKFVGGGQGQGQYAVDGDNVTLTFTATGFAQHFKIQSGSLVDLNTLQKWARTGDAPEAPATPQPMATIAPPPPPPDAPPPTLSVGQTKDQVTAAFGQPLKAAKIGAKDIFYYKDMKVTFLNGKVSNVE